MTPKKMLFTTMASAAALVLPLGLASAQTQTEAGVTDEVQSTVDTAADPAATPPTEPGAEAPATPGESKVVAVTEADVKAGDAVHDTTGGSVGTIESVAANGAVISTGKSRIQVPLASLGKNDKGLVIAMSKAELDAAAAASPPK
jgi:hypothetical protein